MLALRLVPAGLPGKGYYHPLPARHAEHIVSKLKILAPLAAPMTEIKLIFDFCAEARCFDDVYAKGLPPEEEGRESSVHRLSIASLNQKDRDV